MISKYKLRIFKKYGGDIDMFARAGTKSDHKLIEDPEWYTISSLIQNLQLIDKKLVSAEFEQKTLAEIKQKVEPEAVDLLYQISKL
jgi:hypothetical protein